MPWNLIALKLIKTAAAGAFAATTIGLVAERSGGGATLVVHVAEADAVLTIDGEPYDFNARSYEPIVRDVAVGTHRVVLTRRGEVLQEQDVRVGAGEQAVLTAWRVR